MNIEYKNPADKPNDVKILEHLQALFFFTLVASPIFILLTVMQSLVIIYLIARIRKTSFKEEEETKNVDKVLNKNLK